MKTSIVSEGGFTTITLDGALDADAGAQLATLLAEVKDPKVAFNLGKIPWINSIGVSHWVPFAQAVTQGRDVEFRECPETFTSYCNLIAGMIGSGRIASFIVPYQCKPCEAGRLVTIVNDNAAAAFTSQACPECKKPMAPELDADDFLGFWAR